MSDTFTIVVIIWMIFGMPVYIGAFLLGVYVGRPLGSPTLFGMISGLGAMFGGVVASYLVILRIVDRRFREIWLGHRFCPKCEYDLTGISPDVCPECGTPIPRKLAP